MMLLAIDTCFGACSAAVFDSASRRMLATRRVLMQRGHAEATAPMVQDVMRETGLTFSNLGRIAVTLGPGTFTGLRIGLSFAQGLALAHGTPLVGIDTMRATAVPLFGQRVSVCHQAGASGFHYVQHFEADGVTSGPIMLQRPDGIEAPPDAIIIGTGASSFLSAHQRLPDFDLPDAARFASLVATLPVAASALQPIYIREPDAKPLKQSVRALPDLHVSRVGVEAAALLSELHAMSFDMPWDAKAMAEMLAVPGTLALVASTALTPAGFAIFRAIAGEAEILTFATAPSLRGRGVGRRLLQSSEPYLHALQTGKVFLEVAADNQPALRLYGHFNFTQSGLRRGYYERADGTRVDAIMMQRTLP